ncbi:hypothetical protein MPSEU_000223000 [Mayamaea pseudoterrestris]|nr:hypothetical protein MPSEU_000223000 [Mayamaea pseudoterrestris]
MPLPQVQKTRSEKQQKLQETRNNRLQLKQSSFETVLDHNHNRDVPCCRALCELAVDLIDNKTALANILWHLLKRRRQEELALEPSSASMLASGLHNESDAAAKKKKRKKKKKKIGNGNVETIAFDGKEREEEPHATQEIDATESTDTREEGAPLMLEQALETGPPTSRSHRIRHHHFDAFLDHLLAKMEDQDVSLYMDQFSTIETGFSTIRISHSDLVKSISNIRCKDCKERMNRFISHRAQICLDQKPAASFDYMAMEEGLLSLNAGCRLRFERLDGLEKTNGDLYWALQVPLDGSNHEVLQAILDLMHDHVLALGFTQDERLSKMDYKVIELTKQKVEAIIGMSKARGREWDEIRNTVLRDVRELELKWHRTETTLTKDLDTLTFAVLDSIDKELNELFHLVRCKMIQPLLAAHIATAAAFSMGGRAEAKGESELKLHIEELLNALMQYFKGCVDSVAEYEQLWQECVSPQGVFPTILTSKKMRGAYRALVGKKLVAIQLLEEVVYNIAHTEVPAGIFGISIEPQTTVRHKLFTRDIFCNKARRVSPMLHSLEQTDRMWETFIGDLCRCTVTCHFPTAQKMEHEHDMQLEQLRASLLNVVQALEGVNHTTTMPREDSAFFSIGVSDDFSMRASALRFLDNLCIPHSLDSLRSSFRLCEEVCTDFWTISRPYCRPMMHPSMQSSSAPLHMPCNLLRAMSDEAEDTFVTDAPCHPGKEEHRAGCILVVLLFQHLSTYVDEWRADTAEKELMKSLTADLGEQKQINDDGVKAKKKSKKRTKKSANLTLEADASGIEDDIKANSVTTISTANGEIVSQSLADGTRYAPSDDQPTSVDAVLAAPGAAQNEVNDVGSIGAEEKDGTEILADSIGISVTHLPTDAAQIKLEPAASDILDEGDATQLPSTCLNSSVTQMPMDLNGVIKAIAPLTADSTVKVLESAPRSSRNGKNLSKTPSIVKDGALESKNNGLTNGKQKLEKARTTKGSVSALAEVSNSAADHELGKTKPKRQKPKKKTGNGWNGEDKVTQATQTSERYRDIEAVDRNVGVYDDNGVFESAYDFLVGRLARVLESQVKKAEMAVTDSKS